MAGTHGGGTALEPEPRLSVMYCRVRQSVGVSAGPVNVLAGRRHADERRGAGVGHHSHQKETQNPIIRPHECSATP